MNLLKNKKFLKLKFRYCFTLPIYRSFMDNTNSNKIKNSGNIQNDKIKKKLIDRFPENIKNYLKLGRYDKPIGYLLLFWPCAWGLTLGAPTLNNEYFKLLGLFFSGSVLMRSSGCIINDIWDQDIDSKVERTLDRPLASKKLTVTQALIFLSGHLTLSLLVVFQLPLYSIIAAFSIMPIVIIYPYMKRLTYFPQFVLGLAFNSGVIVGLLSMTGIINLQVLLPLYGAGILWTLNYDTIYAHMDKIDDLKINVKSTALYFDQKTKPILTLLSLLMIFLFYISIKNSLKKNQNDNKLTNHYILVFGCLTALSIQLASISKVKLDSSLSCLWHFKFHSYFGFLIFLLCLIPHNNKN